MMWFFALLIGFLKRRRDGHWTSIPVYLAQRVLLPNEHCGKVQLLCQPHPRFG